MLAGRSDAARLVAVRAGLRATLAGARAGEGALLAAREAGTLVGVLVASAPGRWPFPRPGLRLRAAALWAEGLAAARRWAAAFDTLAPLQPTEPHGHLAALGVEPAFAGRGIGGALLAAWLAELARTGAPPYLEVDRPENLPFYEKAGLRISGEARVLGVPVWLLTR